MSQPRPCTIAKYQYLYPFLLHSSATFVYAFKKVSCLLFSPFNLQLLLMFYDILVFTMYKTRIIVTVAIQHVIRTKQMERTCDC